MNENLIITMLDTILFIIAVCITEEIICFVFIKSKGKLDDYKKCSKSKAFLPYSFYLYKDKKYLFGVKFVLLAAVLLNVSLTSNSHTYYDIKGNSYKNNMDVLFYDEDSNVYSIDKDRYYFLDSDDHLTDSCYVDINGYVFNADEDLYCSYLSGIMYSLSGEVYFYNRYIYWDKDKQMHYYDNKNDVFVKDYKFTADNVKDARSFNDIPSVE